MPLSILKSGTKSSTTTTLGIENVAGIVPDERILCAKQVQERTGLSRTTIWRLEQAEQFPARRSIALRRVGWLASEIDKWMASRHVGKCTSKLEIPDWLQG